MRKWVGWSILVLSVAMMIATACMWRRSRRVSDIVQWSGQGYGVELASLAGGVQVRDVRMFSPMPVMATRRKLTWEVPAGADWRIHLPAGAATVEWEWAGFALAAGSEVMPMVEPVDAGGMPAPSVPEASADPTTVVYSGSAKMLMRSHQALFVPYWFIIVVAGMPIWWLLMKLPWTLRIRRRRLGGLCMACGYDRRCSPERCPECGAK